MTETQNAPTETASETTKPQPIKKDWGQLSYNEFEKGDLAGFGYYYPEFNSVEAAVSHYGAENLLKKVINPKIAFAIQIKARNKLVETEEEKTARVKSNETENPYKERLEQQLENGEIIVVSPQDAEEWQPSEREVTSISGVTKKMMQALKDAKEAKQKGDNDRFLKLQAEAKEFRAILNQMQDDELNKLEAA